MKINSYSANLINKTRINIQLKNLSVFFATTHTDIKLYQQKCLKILQACKSLSTEKNEKNEKKKIKSIQKSSCHFNIKKKKFKKGLGLSRPMTCLSLHSTLFESSHTNPSIPLTF